MFGRYTVDGEEFYWEKSFFKKKEEKKGDGWGKGPVYPVNTERNQLGWIKSFPGLRTKKKVCVQNNVYRWTNLTNP